MQEAGRARHRAAFRQARRHATAYFRLRLSGPRMLNFSSAVYRISLSLTADAALRTQAAHYHDL